ncbi:hypothetical protein BZG02_05405 [Labilibaculum filiforme]|uniref:SGNH hydrolase-type esterase domain-containing protein n=1 Tax=Labilibaculum filiforme TaxID=1940526 RepID=A0A2N3I1S4_9BACT|nr:SGNH/GDSL hydrolase family protein [Labilibaculum filiforme]PKQ64260.1 hypothetical protein BZG02_05405 [Labilibaculum filiforme]
MNSKPLFKNIKHYSSVAFFVILLFGSVTLHAQKQAKFKTGDKVCFVGNSITQDGRYHMLVHAFCATRFPNEFVEFYNCGISGDVAFGMMNRMDEDILIHQPNYAFLMTGMNDIQSHLYGKDIAIDSAMLAQRRRILEGYQSLTSKIAETFKEENVSPVFMTPSIYDQTAKIPKENNFGANDALKECSVHVRNLGKKYNAPIVDLNPAMEKINFKMQAVDSTSTIVGPDRVHPGDPGHFLMAYNIIKTVMPSEFVSLIAIDSKNRIATKNVDCTVSIHKDQSSFSFDLVQESLPFPVTERFASALDLIPFQDELNKEMLFVSKLSKGKYQLNIDDVIIDTLSNKQLKNGVNMTDYSSTPQYKQAVSVFDLCEKYHTVNRKIRSVAFVQYRMLNKYEGANTIEGKRAYLDINLEKQKGKSWYDYNVKTVSEYFENLPKEKQLWGELKELRNQIFQINKPRKHTYRLVKVLS